MRCTGAASGRVAAVSAGTVLKKTLLWMPAGLGAPLPPVGGSCVTAVLVLRNRVSMCRSEWLTAE